MYIEKSSSLIEHCICSYSYAKEHGVDVQIVAAVFEGEDEVHFYALPCVGTFTSTHMQ